MIKNDDNQFVGNIGIRFLLFRKAIKKTRSQLALELRADPRELEFIEKGASQPGLGNLHFLSLNYGLDLNWLLCGEGGMFLGQCPPGVDMDYVASTLGEGEDGDEGELVRFLDIPAVKRVIMEGVRGFMDKLWEEP